MELFFMCSMIPSFRDCRGLFFFPATQHRRAGLSYAAACGDWSRAAIIIGRASTIMGA